MARTAIELITELERDPEFRARREADDAKRSALAEQRRLIAQPVFDDLRAVGVELNDLYSLYKQPESYPRAVPVLLDHLRRDYPERVLDDIGNALPRKAEASCWDDFKNLYVTTPSRAVRDRLAAAMSGLAVRRHFDDLIAFIHDESLGESRIYFLRPINRIGNRMASGQGRAVIESVATDPVLGNEAVAILRGRSHSQ